MLQELKPVSENHSIGRVIANFFLPQEVLKPELLFESLKKNDLFSKYQRKTLTRSQKINIINSDIKKVDEGKVYGFIFEEFDLNGRLKNILRVSNESQQNRASIIFETRLYTRWDTFFKEMSDDIATIFTTNSFFVQAISLNYIDEFKWNSTDRIPVNKIFNVDSELINKKFLHSENGSIVMLSQNTELNIEERTEISFNNRLKRILINHQYAIVFKEIFSNNEVLEKHLLKENFDLAHNSNKEMLNDLLSQAVNEKIGILKQ